MKRLLSFFLAAAAAAALAMTASLTALAAEQCGLGKVTADGTLNMRSSASMDASVITRIPSDELVVVLGSRGGFYEVSYDGHTGYVSDDYLIKFQPMEAYATDNVNMRSGPSTDSERIGVVSEDDLIYVYSSSGDFYLCVVGDALCYVHKDYVKMGSAPSKTESKDSSSSSSAGKAEEAAGSSSYDAESTAYFVDDPGTYTAEELYVAAQVIYSEGKHQTDESYQAMASVVFNRVRSGRFPDSVIEVVYQKNQFSHPSSNPESFAELVPSEAALEAVTKVFILGESTLPPSVMFFKSASSGREWGSRVYYATIGGNNYYE